MEERFDAIVLGAGIAGLAAAQELSARGLSVVVLEARARVGGRLHTAELAPGLPIDLGGAWIHGLGSPSSLNAIYALALRCGIQVRTTDYDDAVFYDTAFRPLDSHQVSRLDDTFAAFTAFVAGLVARDSRAKSRLSVDAAVQMYSEACGGLSEAQMAELLFQVHNHIESYWAGDGSSMGIGTMDEMRLPGPDAVICGGYGQLTERLAAGLDIRTGQQVTRIAYGPAAAAAAAATAGPPTLMAHTLHPLLDTHAQMPPRRFSCASSASPALPTLQQQQQQQQQVSCHVASGATFLARRVVVTLPLGVLKSGSVAFDPPLAAASPAKSLAVQRLGTGMYNKVILLFGEAFWDPAVMIHRIPPSCERGRWAWILNLQRVLGVPALVAFTTGSFAVEMEALPDHAVGQELLTVLRKLYPGKVPEPRKVVCTRWGADPHSLGSYTYIPVGSAASDCEALRRPLGQALFFAGEATSRLFYGTVHGAYNTALQAVEEIMEAEAEAAVAAGLAADEAMAELARAQQVRQAPVAPAVSATLGQHSIGPSAAMAAAAIGAALRPAAAPAAPAAGPPLGLGRPIGPSGMLTVEAAAATEAAQRPPAGVPPPTPSCGAAWAAGDEWRVAAAPRAAGGGGVVAVGGRPDGGSCGRCSLESPQLPGMRQAHAAGGAAGIALAATSASLPTSTHRPPSPVSRGTPFPSSAPGFRPPHPPSLSPGRARAAGGATWQPRASTGTAGRQRGTSGPAVHTPPPGQQAARAAAGAAPQQRPQGSPPRSACSLRGMDICMDGSLTRAAALALPGAAAAAVGAMRGSAVRAECCAGPTAAAPGHDGVHAAWGEGRLLSVQQAKGATAGWECGGSLVLLERNPAVGRSQGLAVMSRL